MITREELQIRKEAILALQTSKGLKLNGWANLKAIQAYELVSEGRIEDAEHFLDQATKELPVGTVPHSLWGLALADYGFFRRAHYHLEKCASDQTHPEEQRFATKLLVGMRLVQHKGDERWKNYIREGHLMELPIPPGQTSRVFDCGTLREMDTTIGFLDRLASDNRAQADANFLALCAETSFLLGEDQRVLDTCDLLRQKSPAHPALAFERKVWLRQGDNERAEHSKMITLTSEFKEVRVALKEKVASGDSDGAKALIEKATKLSSAKPEILVCQIHGLEEICCANKYQIQEIEPARTVELDFSFVTAEGENRQQEIFSTPSSRFAELKDVQLLDSYSLIMSRDQSLIRESMPENPHYRSHWPHIEFADATKALAQLPTPHHWEGPACSIVTYGLAGTNYFTWMLNILPNILMAAEHSGGWQSINPLFFPYTLEPWQRTILDCLGVSAESRLEYDGEFPVKFDQADYFISCRDEVPCAGELLKLRQKLWERLEIQPVAPHRKLYVSREKMGVRSLVNEVEIRNVYEGAGYEVIHPQAMTFEEQVLTFSSAASIAGPAGAWGGNLIFCQPGAHVAMIVPSDYYGPMHNYTCHLYGLQYAIAVGSFVPTAQESSWKQIIAGAEEYHLDSCHKRYYVPLENVARLIQVANEARYSVA